MFWFVLSSYAYCCYVKNRKCSLAIRDKPSISFSGCGIRFQFYGGVAEYLLENFDTRNIDILCSSGGIYAAVILALDRKMTDWCDRDWKKCYDYWTNRYLYLLFDTDKFHRNMWRGYLPEDAHRKCSDRLHITISRLGIYGFYEDRISTYNSNEELIDAICGTIHIPGLFRNIPRVCGKYAFDGCWTNMKPKTLSTKFQTLVVSLFGRGHIDYAKKMPITKIMDIVKPRNNNVLIRQGYEIASYKHDTFIDCGFLPK